MTSRRDVAVATHPRAATHALYYDPSELDESSDETGSLRGVFATFSEAEAACRQLNPSGDPRWIIVSETLDEV